MQVCVVPTSEKKNNHVTSFTANSAQLVFSAFEGWRPGVLKWPDTPSCKTRVPGHFNQNGRSLEEAMSHHFIPPGPVPLISTSG